MKHSMNQKKGTTSVKHEKPQGTAYQMVKDGKHFILGQDTVLEFPARATMQEKEIKAMLLGRNK